MTAVCAKCGAERDHWRGICPSCGYRADGEAQLVAWLLSTENLAPTALSAVAARIRKGEPLKPTAAMLDRARVGIGAAVESDPGLGAGARAALLIVSLFATPLPAWVIAFWWWRDRPRAAIQAAALAIPSTALFALFWLWAVLDR